MTKNAFLRALTDALADFSREEAKKAVAYYSATIDDRMEDGMGEEEAVESLGKIEDITREIRESLPLNVLMKSRLQREKRRVGGSGLWLALVICGAPLWAPLCIAVLAVIFAAYVVIWSGIVALYAGIFSLAVAGAAGVFVGIVRLFLTSPAAGGMLAGAGTFCLGLFLIALRPALALVKGLVHASANLGRRIKRALFSKKGVA